LPQKVKKEKTSHLVQQAIDLIKEEMKEVHGESKRLIKYGKKVEKTTQEYFKDYRLQQ